MVSCNPERPECFVVQFSGYAQTVPNLVSPNRSRGLRASLAVDRTIKKTLVLQALLHGPSQIVRSSSHCYCSEEEETKESLHFVDASVMLAPAALLSDFTPSLATRER